MEEEEFFIEEEFSKDLKDEDTPSSSTAHPLIRPSKEEASKKED